MADGPAVMCLGDEFLAVDARITVMPTAGLMTYEEGAALQRAIGAATNFLLEVENLAAGAWTSTNEAALRLYRADIQPTVVKAIELFRMIHPLAPYLGGDRAGQLQAIFNEVATRVVAYHDAPNERSMREMGEALVAAVRSSSDLTVMGAAVTEASTATNRITAAAQQLFESRIVEITSNSEKLLAELRAEISSASTQLKREAQQLSEELSARGNETIARTRKTVAGLLLNDAQQQFASAQKGFNWQVVTWSIISFAAIAGFFVVTFVFLSAQQVPDKWAWQIAYYTGIRLVLLGGIAAISSFCLRMLKSQIGLAQLNAHRTRVARSMPGLLEVAPETERLAVLQSLIQSIIGVRESVLSDSNVESLLATGDILEKLLKATKSSGN